MNLFKKQKFSIRKFSVGTFSTLIATLVFLSHPGHAATHDAETNTKLILNNHIMKQRQQIYLIQMKIIEIMKVILQVTLQLTVNVKKVQ